MRRGGCEACGEHLHGRRDAWVGDQLPWMKCYLPLRGHSVGVGDGIVMPIDGAKTICCWMCSLPSSLSSLPSMHFQKLKLQERRILSRYLAKLFTDNLTSHSTLSGGSFPCLHRIIKSHGFIEQIPRID